MAGDERADAIFEASAKLIDQWDEAVRNKDETTQRLIAVKASQLELRLKRIKVGHRLVLGNVMAAIGRAANSQEHREKLLNAFEFAARLRGTAYDDLVDDELCSEAETQLRAIVSGLDTLPPDGRAALLPYLRSYNMDMRAAAAVALHPVMPEHVMQVLRELAEKEMGTSAGALAQAALSLHE